MTFPISTMTSEVMVRFWNDASRATLNESTNDTAMTEQEERTARVVEGGIGFYDPCRAFQSPEKNPCAHT